MFELGNTAALMWGMLFGSIGIGFAILCQDAKGRGPALCGSCPLCLPLLCIANVYVLVLVGVVLMAIPYFVWGEDRLPLPPQADYDFIV